MKIVKQIKKRLIPYACRTLLSPKSFSNLPKNIERISCSEKDVRLITNTSNNVMIIEKDGRSLYFRECKIHKEIHKYVADEINYYYSKVSPQYIEDKLFLENALSENHNFKKFVNMGMTNDKTSGVYHFCMGHGGEYIGLNGLDSKQEKRFQSFAQYIWGDLFAYMLNKGVKINQYQIYNAVRSVSFYRVAKLLDLEYLVPKTEFAILNIGSEKIFGTVMEEAQGTTVEKESVEYRRQISSPSLQHSLNNLNLLDVICFEKDHRVGNYTVTTKNGKAVSVNAFDNDSPNSFGMGNAAFKTYMGCSPLILKGSLNRPYVDEKLAQKILELNDGKLENSLGNLLNRYQMFALKRRIKSVKKVLSTAPQKCFLSDEQWNDNTMADECSGKYGNTYLTEFLSKQRLVPMPWLEK